MRELLSLHFHPSTPLFLCSDHRNESNQKVRHLLCNHFSMGLRYLHSRVNSHVMVLSLKTLDVSFGAKTMLLMKNSLRNHLKRDAENFTQLGKQEAPPVAHKARQLSLFPLFSTSICCAGDSLCRQTSQRKQ